MSTARYLTAGQVKHLAASIAWTDMADADGLLGYPATRNVVRALVNRGWATPGRYAYRMVPTAAGYAALVDLGVPDLARPTGWLLNRWHGEALAEAVERADRARVDLLRVLGAGWAVTYQVSETDIGRWLGTAYVDGPTTVRVLTQSGHSVIVPGRLVEPVGPYAGWYAGRGRF